MMNKTITNQDKIKLLDQMLEDLSGDELDSYDDSINTLVADMSQQASSGPADLSYIKSSY